MQTDFLAEQHSAPVDAITVIDLGHIDTLAGTQLRVSGLDDDAIDRYAAIFAGHTDGVAEGMPPISVYSDDGETPPYYLADGFHRLAAAEQADCVAIPAIIKAGSKRDALFEATGANGQHGVALSNADKRNIVDVLLADPEWSTWTDRQIADRVPCSHTLVSDIRRERKQAAQTAAPADQPSDSDRPIVHQAPGHLSAKDARWWQLLDLLQQAQRSDSGGLSADDLAALLEERPKSAKTTCTRMASANLIAGDHSCWTILTAGIAWLDNATPAPAPATAADKPADEPAPMADNSDYQAGADAFAAHQPWNANPHKINTSPCINWSCGWHDALDSAIIAHLLAHTDDDEPVMIADLATWLQIDIDLITHALSIHPDLTATRDIDGSPLAADFISAAAQQRHDTAIPAGPAKQQPTAAATDQAPPITDRMQDPRYIAARRQRQIREHLANAIEQSPGYRGSTAMLMRLVLVFGCDSHSFATLADLPDDDHLVAEHFQAAICGQLAEQLRLEFTPPEHLPTYADIATWWQVDIESIVIQAHQAWPDPTPPTDTEEP